MFRYLSFFRPLEVYVDREVNELETALETIWEIATKKFGLDPYPTHFEIVPASVMYEVGSYALPGRYSHWSFGKAYHKMKTMYDLGLSKIYEVVINSNPAYAFLLENNSLLQNKLVIAHVLGHVDFFKHNAYFSQTNRRMVDDAAMHARRINEYEFKYGRKIVEDFLDAVLSIEEHIDPNFFIKKNRDGEEPAAPARPRDPYADLATREEREALKGEDSDDTLETPMRPEKDLVWYICRNSPVLAQWQRDVMSMIHDEMLYFVPQMQTKIMNEGWASLWHARIMRELDLPDREHIEFAELHSGVVSPHRGQLNPYYLGYKIWEDIERRWDHPSERERTEFGRRGGEGSAKIFEVRELENDVSFLRNYLTEELCEELDLFVYELVEEEDWTVTEKRWERVRDQLVANMTNFGFPYIEVVDGDYEGNRELYLMHRYEGAELDLRYARKVLEHIHRLWGRRVHLETKVDQEPLVLSFDGEEHSER
ncbi:MAG: SpoVR family protein [Blastocatellales bacterium]|nr:SpoVR family protein [Blastocatellales bacterium]